MQKQLNTIDDYFIEPDVHDEFHVDACGAVGFVVAILFGIAHGINAYLLITGSIGLGVAIVFHLILSFVAGVLARAFISSPSNSRWFLLLFIATTTLGVFGACGTVVAILQHYWFMRYSQPFSLWFSSIFPHAVRNDAQRIYEDIQVGRDESSKPYSVIPFLDVLWYGNEAQKRMALSKMTSRFHPSFANTFKKALNDPSNTIRVQAATAINKIENQFLDRLMKLQKLHDQHPDNPLITLALASHYDDYAFTGILDADREHNNREQALLHYMAYLDARPSDTDVLVKVGRLLLRNGEAPRAADWFTRSLEGGHRSQSLLVWYCEALYGARRFTELRRFAHDAKWKAGDEINQAGLIETLNFWQTEGGRV